MAIDKIQSESINLTDDFAFTGTVTGAGVSNKPAWLVTKNANQSISSDTNTVLTWQTEIIDTNSAFASNKFTVPSGEGGAYFLTAQIRFNDMVNTDEAQLAFKKNGAYEFNDGNQNNYIVANMKQGANGSIFYAHQAIVNLSASNYIEVAVFTNGGTRVINATYTRFGGYKLF